MREILFRAYLKKEKQIVNVLDIDFMQKTIGYMNKADTKYTCVKFEDIELLQYTGLKDKNGTKIFEGDIINWYGELVVVKYGEYRVTRASNEFGQNFRDVETFGWYGERQGEYRQGQGIDLSVICFGEIIGNIYDNKDL